MNLRHVLMGAAACAICASAAAAERGTDGQVNVIYWQAVSIMTPYLSNGVKDLEAASLVLEPLARFDEKGAMVPYLAEGIPTVENGGVGADLTTITWKLKAGLLWSDGSPVTAEDVVFTWQYCADPRAAAQLPNFGDVTNVEAVDPQTVKVTLRGRQALSLWAVRRRASPILQKAQFADCIGAEAPTCTEANTRPIGTGPFRVTDFKANDVVVLEINQNYRDPAKPAFASVVLKGGGDAASAARSVLETGEFDYAWNPQVEPEMLAQMAGGRQGRGDLGLRHAGRAAARQPDRSRPGAGRRALDRGAPAPVPDRPERGPGAGDGDRPRDPGRDRLRRGRAGDLQPGAGAGDQASTNNDWCQKQDIEGAKKLLDEAGWVPGGDGVREKDGRRLSILYQTSTNSVRQAAQALIKQWWEEIGVEVELRNIDAACSSAPIRARRTR